MHSLIERTILHQHLQRFTVIWAIGPDIYRCIRSNHNRLGIYTEIQFICWHSIVVFLCSVMLLDLVEFWVNSSPCARETLLSQCGRCESAKFSRDRTDCSLCNWINHWLGIFSFSIPDKSVLTAWLARILCPMTDFLPATLAAFLPSRFVWHFTYFDLSLLLQ